MNPTIDALEKKGMRTVPSFGPGDTIRVHVRIKEGDKERVQRFQGIVMQRKNEPATASFTVRKISNGIGVERIFPLSSPFIDKIEVNKVGIVRRAKLYYLRARTGKAARIREKVQRNEA